MSYDDPKMRVTLSGKPPEPGYEGGEHCAPAPIDPATGMHKDYWVLPESERQKGYVRPYRDTYRHIGDRPRYPTRALTEEEQERHRAYNYVAYEPYPKGEGVVGRYWTEKQLKSGCGSVTKMGHALSETYARDPEYYGSTFCVACRDHFPVREFVWEKDGKVVGS